MRRSPRRVAAALGSVLVLVLLVGVIAVALANRPDGVATPPGASSAPAPTDDPGLPSSTADPTASERASSPSPTETPSPPAPSFATGCVDVLDEAPSGSPDRDRGWELLEPLDVTDVAGARGRVVVVGSAGGSAPAAWYSDEGRSFVEADLPDVLSDATPTGLLWSVEYGRCGWVATGARFREFEDRGPIVLHSTDGITWGQASLPDSCMLPAHLAAGSFGYVTVGRSCDAGEFDAAPIEMWWSDDGMTWVPAAPGAAMAEHGLGRLATDGDRLVGLSLSPWVEGAPVRVWVSTDGRTWSHVLTDLPTGLHLEELAADDTGFLALGYGGAGAVACRSADGAAWTCVDLEIDPLGWEGHLTHDGNAFVAVSYLGSQEDPQTPYRSRLSRSTDGIAWTQSEFDPNQLSMHGVASTPFGLYLWAGTQPIGLEVSEPVFLLQPSE